MRDKVSSGDEFEATLAVCSEHPGEVAGEIAGLEAVSSYSLIDAGTSLFRDLYFDTVEDDLNGLKLGLRIREIDDEHRLALKGPARLTEWGAMRRLEIEGPWSEKAVGKVLEELERRNVGIAVDVRDIDRLDCLDFMYGLGMKVIQERETQRRIRKIFASDRGGDTELAELDIDASVYYFGGRDVRHFEIEIEAKSTDGFPVVKVVHEGLKDAFGGRLRVWIYDKLATGKAIERLLGEGALAGLLDGENNLKPGAYDVLAEYLERDGI